MDIQSLQDNFQQKFLGNRIGYDVAGLVKYKNMYTFVIDPQKYWIVHEDQTIKITFSLPGGTVEPGETVVKALQREIKEELTVPALIQDSPMTWYLDNNNHLSMVSLTNALRPVIIHEHRQC